MPAALWDEAEAVAFNGGLYATARGAGIDDGTLAKRMNSNKPALARMAFPAAASCRQGSTLKTGIGRPS